MQGPTIIKWFVSRRVREGWDLLRRTHKGLQAQRDILSQASVDAINQASTELRQALHGDSASPAIPEKTSNLEKVGQKWFKPYSNAAMREQVDVLLVALTVALAIRTFFFQPMAI